MAAKVGSFAKATGVAPASQVITGLGFRPKAIILWTVGATANDAYAGGIRWAMGMADGATQGTIAASLDDNTANTNAGRNTARKALCIVDGDGAVLAECDLTSLGADGFTLSWTTNNATAYIIYYMALGGDNLQVKVKEWHVATSTGNQAVTGIGFQPETILSICGDRSTLGTGTTGARAALFFAGNTAWSAGWSCADGLTTGRAFSGNTTTDINDFLASVDYAGVMVSLDADGFTYNLSSAASDTWYVYSLCMAGGDYATATTAKPTSTSVPVTQDVTGLGHTPEVVLLILNHNSTATYGMCFAVGASDGVNEVCGLITDEYVAPTIEAKNYSSISKSLVQDYSSASATPDQVTDSECDMASLASGKFTLSWTSNDGNASKFGYLAFNNGAYTPPVTSRLGIIGAEVGGWQM